MKGYLGHAVSGALIVAGLVLGSPGSKAMPMPVLNASAPAASSIEQVWCCRYGWRGGWRGYGWRRGWGGYGGYGRWGGYGYGRPRYYGWGYGRRGYGRAPIGERGPLIGSYAR